MRGREIKRLANGASQRTLWKPNLHQVRFGRMTEKELFNKASDVTAKDGQVLVDGPDGVDVALTPEAAEKTADRLIENAVRAAGQRHFKEMKEGKRL